MDTERRDDRRDREDARARFVLFCHVDSDRPIPSPADIDVFLAFLGPASAQEEENRGNNLHVSGLSLRVEERDLEAAFSKYGRVRLPFFLPRAKALPLWGNNPNDVVSLNILLLPPYRSKSARSCVTRTRKSRAALPLS